MAFAQWLFDCGFILITQITKIHFGINSVAIEMHNSEFEEVHSSRTSQVVI